MGEDEYLNPYDLANANSNAAQDALFRRNLKFVEGGSIPSEDVFYFRLSGSNIYYTETREEVSVLGAISVDNIEGTNPVPPTFMLTTQS